MRRISIPMIAIATLLALAILSPAYASKHQLSNAGTETGMATCYSHHLVGHRTASGKRYDPNKLTAAHSKIPIGSHVKVTNVKNGKSVVVVVNDHMSSHSRGIIMDVSRKACKELKFGKGGKAEVKLEVLHTKEASN
jgi:rare lipoprotein A